MPVVNRNRIAKRPIAVDLFAGAGGLGLGFEQAGFDIAAAVEYDPIHAAVHKFNFPYGVTICRDVSKIGGDDIRRAAGIGRDPVDVVCGGPPCQGFSMIGKRALDDSRNMLVYHFVRLVVELKARYFVFENVKGLTVGEHKKFLDELIGEFTAAGYNIVLPYRVLNAADFGVPQDRRRLFLLGAKRGLPLPAYPAPLFVPAGKADSMLPSGPSVWDAIGDLPEIEDCDTLIEMDSARLKFGKPSSYAEMLRSLKTDLHDRSYPRRFDPEILTSSLRTEHTQKSRSRFSRTRPGDTEPVSRFIKLDPAGVCNTLRAGTASDRGAFTSPRPIHPYTPRCISVREAARLHSYPDWFRFHATKWHGFRQVGNSVPPFLARAVAERIAVAMDLRPIRPSAIDLGDERLLKMTMAEAMEHFGIQSRVIAQRTRGAIGEADRSMTANV